MIKFFKIILLLIFLYIVLFSLEFCGKKSVPKVIEKNKFVQIYCDVVTYADIIDANMRNAFVDSIFKNYNVTQNDFKHTTEILSQNLEEWQQVYQAIVDELEKRKQDLEKDNNDLRKKLNNIKE